MIRATRTKRKKEIFGRSSNTKMIYIIPIKRLYYSL